VPGRPVDAGRRGFEGFEGGEGTKDELLETEPQVQEVGEDRRVVHPGDAELALGRFLHQGIENRNAGFLEVLPHRVAEIEGGDPNLKPAFP